MLPLPVARSLAALALALCLVVGVGPAAAREVAGVAVAETVDVGGRTLRLNGAGLRTRWFFKVYVAALYLPTPARSTEEALAPESPRAFVMQFLRDVSREKLVAALDQGFRTNAGEKAQSAAPQIARLLEVVKSMHAGDRLTFTYEPGRGSTVTMTDGTVAHFDGRDFADAFLLLWLGPRPPRQELKRALLGGA
jgi:hypothetical protein